MTPGDSQDTTESTHLEFQIGNIEIPPRKVAAFIGPSGCGKSTLLRVFNRMFELYPEQRAEGRVELDGEDILSSKMDVSLIRA